MYFLFIKDGVDWSIVLQKEPKGRRIVVESVDPTIGWEEYLLGGNALETLSGGLNIQLFGQNPRGVNIDRREVDRLLNNQNTLWTSWFQPP